MEDSGTDMEKVMAASKGILATVVVAAVVVVVVVVVVSGDVVVVAVALVLAAWERFSKGVRPGMFCRRADSKPLFPDKSDIRAVTFPPDDDVSCDGSTIRTGAPAES